MLPNCAQACLASHRVPLGVAAPSQRTFVLASTYPLLQEYWLSLMDIARSNQHSASDSRFQISRSEYYVIECRKKLAGPK